MKTHGVSLTPVSFVCAAGACVESTKPSERILWRQLGRWRDSPAKPQSLCEQASAAGRQRFPRAAEEGERDEQEEGQRRRWRGRGTIVFFLRR